MKLRRNLILAFGTLPILAALAIPVVRLTASDHADTAGNVNRQGADLTDVFIFPSPTNANNVVLVMDVHGLIPAGQGPNFAFDPNVLYQFKIDVSQPADYVEDLVIQARFSGTGASQKVLISGPARPYTTGTTATFASPSRTIGTINQPFTIALPGNQGNMQVFAGVRSDPFFFDLTRFYSILPDRATPLSGSQVEYGDGSIMAADAPHAPVSFRGFPAGSPAGYDTTPAVDYLANLNVLSIVVELPRSALGGGVIRLWETTNVSNGFNFVQQDRLARPAINEVLATVTQSRHDINNKANPTDDPNNLIHDIDAFLSFPAGRSLAIRQAIESVLIPDVMVADLSKPGNASFLGNEVAGGFGGRALTDDIVDTELSIVFGNTIPTLFPTIPDDHAEIGQLTTDHVGPHTDFLGVFPYLGNPH